MAASRVIKIDGWVCQCQRSRSARHPRYISRTSLPVDLYARRSSNPVLNLARGLGALVRGPPLVVERSHSATFDEVRASSPPRV